MFETILIANRGEIACRILSTARRLGVRTVAVYADADRDAPFVRLADAAYPLGRSEPEHSYLRAERILCAALHAGAQAIHPGYGFLAENAQFAEACAREGIVFVGPPPSAIRAMGRKDAAKERMEQAGVRVLPGYSGEAQTVAALAAAAEEIGYPVLIKAVAGGGGKGMRRVDDARAFPRLLESAQREAEAAFGDARVLLEKYLARSRHIEVQVFADRHGQAVHLFTRDCSLQRRHQKVVEEAPAPGARDEIEQAACALALAATRAIGYEGAGTVELLADVSAGLLPERVYFMEMNTRLQVEHPVTERITGLDLVAWQLRVAAGERLPRTQSEITRHGHAIEVRLYAEDPARDFMPQSGRLAHLRLPAADAHVRVDAGFVEGDAVSVYYDALLAKIIVWGEDRAAAVRRLERALAATEVAGVVTNLALLAAIARDASFREGDVHTAFLHEHGERLLAPDPERDERLWMLACIGRLEARRARAASDPSPWADTRAFRVNEPHTDLLAFECAGDKRTFAVTFVRETVLVVLATRTVAVRHVRRVGAEVVCEVDGRRVRGVYVEHASGCFVFAEGSALDAPFWPSPLAHDDEAGDASFVKAPMPGKIHAVMVAEGERVARGQPLLSLEAMKMEHTLRAAGAGHVAALHVRVGEQVDEGRTLIVLHPEQEA